MNDKCFLKSVKMRPFFFIIFITFPSGFLFAQEISDISHDVSLMDGLVSYWPLDEVSGTREDVKGNNDLSDFNTVGQTSGKQGFAATFSRSENQRLTILNDGGITNGAMSWSAWVQPKQDITYGDTECFASVFDSGTHVGNDLCYDNSTGTKQLLFNRGLPGVTSHQGFYATLLTVGTWHHLVMTFDGAILSAYLDGNPMGSVPAFGNGVISGIDNISIGSRYWSDEHYVSAAIDEVGLWNRALTAEEVVKLYNDGKGLPYEATEEVSPEDCSDLTLKECIAKLETKINSTDLPRVVKKWLHIRIWLVEKMLEKKGKGKERAAEAILNSILRTFDRKVMSKYLSETEISELTVLTQSILDKVKN